MARVSNAEKMKLWAERLGRYGKSGLTVARFCQAEGVSQPSFYLWKKKLADARAEQAKPTRSSARNGKPGRRNFQAVVVSPSCATAEQRATTIRLTRGVEIELGGNLRVVDQVVASLVKQLLEVPGDRSSTGGRAC